MVITSILQTQVFHQHLDVNILYYVHLVAMSAARCVGVQLLVITFSGRNLMLGPARHKISEISSSTLYSIFTL